MSKEELFKKAVAWGTAQSERGTQTGRQLTKEELKLAERAGILYPERVRVVHVTVMPEPEDGELYDAAKSLGLLGNQFAGLTLGYTIFVKGPQVTPRLMAHELRHVMQFELHGGIESFLPYYLNQVMTSGYRDAPYEKDAREFAHRMDC